jgi:hypothetical protein
LERPRRVPMARALAKPDRNNASPRIVPLVRSTIRYPLSKRINGGSMSHMNEMYSAGLLVILALPFELSRCRLNPSSTCHIIFTPVQYNECIFANRLFPVPCSEHSEPNRNLGGSDNIIF